MKKNKTKRQIKDKLINRKNKLIRLIGECEGCSECGELQIELRLINKQLDEI